MLGTEQTTLRSRDERYVIIKLGGPPFVVGCRILELLCVQNGGLGGRSFDWFVFVELERWFTVG